MVTSSSLSTTITNTSASIINTIVTDANSKIVKPVVTPTAGTGLYLTSEYLGYYNDSNSTWNAYIRNNGDFLFKKDDDNLLSFGGNVFTLKTGTATISGSAVNIVAPTFFLGNNSQYISGSGGKLEIKSNNFRVEANGNVSASNIDISGVSEAGTILNKTIVITPQNSASYLYIVNPVNYPTSGDYVGPPYYQLYLNGVLGGATASKVLIACSFPKRTISGPGYTYSYTNEQLAIGNIVFPTSSNGLSTCIIETAITGVYFRNDITGSGFTVPRWQMDPNFEIYNPYNGYDDQFGPGTWFGNIY